MILYGKVINEQTGLCEVGTGSNIEFYKSIGYVELDVKQSDIDNSYYLSEKCPMKSDEAKAKEEAERIAKLNLTRGDVFRGIYQAKQISRNDLREMIVNNETISMFQKELALIDFDEALNFFRGNPLIDIMGKSIGLTKEQLDRFFETNNYLYLTDCTLTINATPVEATVVINEIEQNSIKVPYSTPMYWSVSAEGYIAQDGGFNIKENTVLDITLEKVSTEEKPKTKKLK